MIPEKIRKLLDSVEKPGRYVGGEYGIIRKSFSGRLKFALSFPDLYEIGMANNAVKLLYADLNRREDVVCERVFAPAPDFESALKDSGVPLYTLESFSPVNSFHVLGFTIGYELSATNMLAVLETSGIPILRVERTELDPVVIAGGPACTNPLPLSDFLDGVFLGEAESIFDEILPDLVSVRGEGRQALLDVMKTHSSFWYPGKTGRTVRALWQGFSTEIESAKTSLVPTLETALDNGVVEIMRGCPNGCRFCHAGYFYRQQRERDLRGVVEICDHLVTKLGYGDITLSSLSSGDYKHLDGLIDILTERYTEYSPRFSLPSLKVESFKLPLLEKLGITGASGLTFAVESPTEKGQRSLNKLVPLAHTIAIAKEAKKRGWRRAKLYFMVGLPDDDSVDVKREIVEYVMAAVRESGLAFHVNIAAFVPKPHTPYQWAGQLDETSALSLIMGIKRDLKHPKIKVSYHSPFAGVLEGIISRGDERVGKLILKAYHKGARLDAWDDFLDRDLWRRILDEHPWSFDILKPSTREGNFPWSEISLGISKGFLLEEKKRSETGELTEICGTNCTVPCGVCGKSVRVGYADPIIETLPTKPRMREGSEQRIAVSFSFEGGAEFCSHLNKISLIERSLRRAGYRIRLKQGLKPKPMIEFPSPLGLGTESLDEIVVLVLTNMDESFSQNVNKALPQGVTARLVHRESYIHGGPRFRLTAKYLGATYRIDIPNDYDPKKLQAQGFAVEIDQDSTGPRAFDVDIGPFTAIPSMKRFWEMVGGRGSVRLKKLRSYFDDGNGGRISAEEFFSLRSKVPPSE